MRDHAIHLHVNNDGTYHDQFCRCRSCKPGLAPRDEARLPSWRVTIGCAGLSFVIMAKLLIAGWA